MQSETSSLSILFGKMLCVDLKLFFIGKAVWAVLIILCAAYKFHMFAYLGSGKLHIHGGKGREIFRKQARRGSHSRRKSFDKLGSLGAFLVVFDKIAVKCRAGSAVRYAIKQGSNCNPSDAESRCP